MNERDALHILRIKDEIDFVVNNFVIVSESVFLQDEMIQRAAAMSLITIGEPQDGRLNNVFKNVKAI